MTGFWMRVHSGAKHLLS